MKIAIFQMNSVLGDLEKNLAKINDGATEASANGAKLLICPELVPTGYGAGDDLHAKAMIADHDGLGEICKISKDNNIAIIIGYAEKTDTGYANSAVFIADGKIKANYNKCQLWGDYEHSYFKQGSPSAVVVDYGGLRIGMLICYDIEFPERVRILAKAGAHLIAVPTATQIGSASKFIAEKMVAVRSFENQNFVAYVNYHGDDGKFTYGGRSCVCAPDGTFLAQADEEGEALLYAVIAQKDYVEFCKETPYLEDLIEV